MERMYVTGTRTKPPVQKKVRTKGLKMVSTRRVGRRMGLIKIGTLLEPLCRIINHPDRNRLIAGFFQED